MNRIILTLVAALLAFFNQAHAAPSVEVSWVAPQTTADGSAPASLSGFRVYWGTQSGYYFGSVLVPNPAINRITLSGLPVGLTYFAVTAIGTNGQESEFSFQASKTITAAPDNLPKPTALSVQ